jgi:hypothetical protein
MEPTPVDPRIQYLFEKMADEYEGEFAMISWDPLQKEAIFQFHDGSSSARRASVSLKTFMRQHEDGLGNTTLTKEFLVEIGSMVLIGGEWYKNEFPKVVVSMLPSAVLAIITR